MRDRATYFKAILEQHETSLSSQYILNGIQVRQSYITYYLGTVSPIQSLTLTLTLSLFLSLSLFNLVKVCFSILQWLILQFDFFCTGFVVEP